MSEESGSEGESFVDGGLVAGTRVLLAAAMLAFVYIDPAKPDHLVGPTYTGLACYLFYSLLVLAGRWRRPRFAQWANQWAHWVDVGWFTVLIALHEATDSIFFPGLFFAILVASFRKGFQAGMSVVAASAAFFVALGLITHSYGQQFRVAQFLLRPSWLLVLGFLIAQWGGVNLRSRRRLQLMRSLVQLSNPRFGVEQTLRTLLEKLRLHYQADGSFLVVQEAGGDSGRLYRCRPDGHDKQALPNEVAQEWLMDGRAYFYSCRQGVLRRPSARSFREDVEVALSEAQAGQLAEIAALLDSDSLLSISLEARPSQTGRLFLTRRHPFSVRELRTALQVIHFIVPVLDNIRLVDQLASSAAEEERKRIARDLHDSVIQPYLGLRMGLEGVRIRLKGQDEQLERELDRLWEMTGQAVDQLRGYVGGLKQSAPSESLGQALERFAERFGQASGIRVELHTPDQLRLNDRLAAEVFQLVAEALSNVRRHSRSSWARVRLEGDGGRLLLSIANQASFSGGLPFRPRSIEERAAALGGELRVETGAEQTVVEVEIPL